MSAFKNPFRDEIGKDLGDAGLKVSGVAPEFSEGSDPQLSYGVPLRFTVISRTGHRWSYPYSYVGLIDCPSPENIVIHGNCGSVEVISIKGRGLDRVFALLESQRLTELVESDRPAYESGPIVVAEVKVKRTHQEGIPASP